MGANDNSTVSITIQVVDANSQSAIEGVETKLVGLGATGAAVGSQLSSTTQKLVGFNDAIIRTGGAVGAVDPALAAARAQALQMQQALTSITTASIETAAALNAVAEAAQRGGARMGQSFSHTGASIQGVRLAVQELGLRVPRAMESAIASNTLLSTGLQATMGIFLAIGAIQIFAQMGKEAYELYEQWFDVSKAVEDYEKKARDAAQQKLFDTASLETATQLLKQANDQIDQLQQKKEAAGANLPGGGFFQYFQGMAPVGHTIAPPTPRYTTQDDATMAQAMKNRDAAQARITEEQDKFDKQRLENQEAYNTTALQGYGKVHAQLESNLAIAQQELAVQQAHEQTLAKQASAQGKTYAPDYNAGWQQYVLAADKAHKEAQAQAITLGRQEQTQVIQMQNVAIDAGVKGEALFAEQRQQAIDEIARKVKQQQISERAGIEETQAIDMKFHNEQMQRIDEQTQATVKMEQAARGAGLTGIPKIEADRQAGLQQIDYNANQGGFADPSLEQRQRVAVNQEADQKILQARQQFTERIQQIEQSSQSQMTSGYARIAAQEKQQLTELAKAYQETNGADQKNWQAYQDEKLRLEQNSDREREQYSRQINEQISQTEAQAARLVLPPWQAAQAGIIDEYRQRMQKIRAEVDQQVITEQQGAREVNAAWALANAQMQKESEQSRNQIAGQLEQLFSDPSKYMQQRAKQMMMEILANWVQQLEQSSPRMQGIIGGLLGQNPMGTGSPKHALSAMFGGQHSESLGMPTAQLSSAGSTLTSAGMTLSSSGTMLMNAAQAIAMAASQMGTGNPLASGGFGGVGGSGGGWTGIGDMPSMGSPTLWGGDSAAGLNGGSSGAYSVAGTATGGAAGAVSAALSAPQGMTNSQMAMSTGNTVLQGLQLATMLKTAGASGTAGAGGAPSMNLGGDDDNPTNDYGMGGDSDSDSGSSQGGSASRALGMAGGLISGGMGLFSAWQSASNSKTFAGGLTSMIGGAMSGAMIGTMFAPGIGTAIGAAAGAMVGLMGDIFGDHGRSKAQQYNIATVIPGLQKAMDGFSFGGDSYDSASQEIAGLQAQAQNQCKQWGSGAWDFYKGTITPEITAAQDQVNREGQGGRSNVTMSAAQFDSGGVVQSFGDFSTGPHSGFIHARLGERVMNPMASMMFGSTLDAMNSGPSMVNRMAKAAPLGGGGAVTVVFAPNISAWDSRDVDRWLRGGGGMQLQEHLNQNAGRYAGRALNGR